MNTFVWICYLFFAGRRLLTYLHIFQQEEYDDLRFVSWIFKTFALDRRATALLLVLWLGESIFSVPALMSYFIPPGIFLFMAVIERDPRRSAKKPLAMTVRAKRVFYGALVFSGLLGGGAAFWERSIWAWIIAVQAIPLMLLLANICLRPYEKRIQNMFWNEAHAKLTTLKPTTVGITGSYGKTSVKHILGHLLASQGQALITPGSVNTAMGISRVVREQMGPHHRYFVCEMGAYGHGSIARLCCLAPPDLAVITAIGPAHYERFRSLDAVVETKFELAESVVARGGKVVVAEGVLKFKRAQVFSQEHPNAMVIVGTSMSSSLQQLEYRQTGDGLSVVVRWRGKEYVLKARLYGEHHATNLSVAFAAACILGMPPDDVAISMSSVPQISHRLEVKRQSGGPVIIDDAYNSNPLGFANGLSLLDLLRSNGGRRILVTPGMVELGDVHDQEHRKIGTLAGAHVDILLAVLPDRIGSLVEAYRESNVGGEVVRCDTFADAQHWLQSNLQAQDVVLLENDLPDLYESRITL